ncbi:MAG: dihydropteroate synthase [Desulfobacterales bacterium]|nr:dihydropteroate synthase [Desulfobacterales bacterium]
MSTTNSRTNYRIAWGNHVLELGKKTCIMGILNITPDSFSDGGQFMNSDTAISHAKKLIDDGADILDIGGESTRPYAESISEDEEIRRVVPVIQAISKYVSVPISIDTMKAKVAEKALQAGASMINDISALRFDPNMGKVAHDYQVPIILMHMKGNPKTMQVAPEYHDLLAEVTQFLNDALTTAENYSIPPSHLIVDPGIGFGKTFHHNIQLIKHLDALNILNQPIIIGPSRKAFIRNILSKQFHQEIQPDSFVADMGTQATIALSIINGAHIVRVHNVSATRSLCAVLDEMLNTPALTTITEKEPKPYAACDRCG